jgi:hypothetical protein
MDALSKYEWNKDNKYPHFYDTDISEICHIKYNHELDKFYVFENTYMMAILGKIFTIIITILPTIPFFVI